MGEAAKEALGVRLGVDFGVPSTPKAKERARPKTGTGKVGREGEEEEEERGGEAEKEASAFA